MKLRVGACALMLVLAGCSGEGPGSGMAGMRGVAATGDASGKLPVALPLSRAIGASIANAPDRGALISYANKAAPAKQEGAYTWYPIAISEAHAFKGVATGEMTVPAPDGSQVKLRYERHVEEIDGNWTWIGRVVGGDPMQEAIITFGEKAVFGSIPQANGKPALSLQTRQGAVYAVQTDPSKVVSATKGYVDIMVPEAAALRSSMGAVASEPAQVAQAATAIAQSAPQSPTNTIDVAIGYTPEFATANGGASGAATRLVYLIQVGNQAFSNSGIDGYLRIVHALQVSYTNTNTNQTALSELTGSNGQSAVTIPSSLAPLRAARDTYGADIAVLVRKFNTPENAGCGIAWLNGAGQTAITAADASWGYAVISDGYDQGTDGKTYYCADETLVHETAHLMGSAHDRANSLTSSGGLQYGRYAYSFGYKTAAAAGNFYTVMAYGDTGQIAHRIFSTPLKSTCGSGGNLACGVANSEDNARSLNQTIPVVSTFRSTVVPLGGAKISDFTGDGRSDILLQGVAAGRYSIWAMNSATRLATYNGDTLAGFSVAAKGDLDGNGFVDSFWSNGSGDIWVLKGTSATQRQFVKLPYRVATSYALVGAADLNGDGKADLIFHSTSVNRFSVWFMDDTTRTGSGSGAMYAGYTLAAIGEFTGVGTRQQTIWISPAGKMSMLAYPSKSFTLKALFSDAASGFALRGAGDFDGDGMHDLVFSSAAKYEVWVMNDRKRTSLVSADLPSGYSVASIGDYDGNGSDSILLNNASRQLQSASLSGTTLTATAIASLTYSATFTIVNVP